MADRERDRFVALAFCRADILIELDDQQQVVFAAGATARLLGLPAEQLEGQPFSNLVTPADRTMIQEILNAARGLGRIDDVLVRLHGAQLRPQVVMGGYRVPDFNDHFFLALKVETLSSAQREEPRKTDPETGLLAEADYANLAAERALAFRKAGGRPQITMVKVNDLSSMAKALGVTDRKRIMAAVGDILAKHSLGGGTAGRVSSDAFSYLHRDDVDPAEVTSMISDAAKKLFNTDIKADAHTLDADGAGLAEDQVAKAIAHTIRNFDAAGSLDKKKSIGQVLKGLVADTIDNVATIRHVVAEHDFDVAFMPICDLRLERVQHFEALTRFRDAKLGESPYHLFSLAEEVGIVNEMDMAVCERTIQTLNRLTIKDGLLPSVAINLSGLSLSNPQFVEQLYKLLARSGIQPRKLMFELTESARIDHLTTLNNVIQTFRAKGFKFCLDDFGSGAASFDYLNALDVDVVKFDGPVVKRACASQKGSDLLAAMTRMCASMGIRTVAEMVEDKRMAGRVYQCGVDMGQGYYFGKAEFDPFVFQDRFIGQGQMTPA